MKKLNYDITTQKILGWYDEEIHSESEIPEPFIEFTDDEWMEAINNNYNYVDIETNTLSIKDFRSDEELKNALIRAEKDNYFKLNQEDIAYMGTVFQADNDSQQLIVSVLSVGDLPEGFFWLDKDNNQIPMTHTDLQGLSKAILIRNQANFTNFLVKKQEILDSTLPTVTADTTGA
jgi:hypothetical protein